jgi:voltage-gated potassium channel
MLVLLVRVLGVGHRRHVAVLLSAAVASTLIWGALFAHAEGYPLTTGLYWAITTATTVGYGDVIPHNAAGRVVASATMLTTIPLLASVFALVTGAAAAAGVRRILGMGHEFPAGAYRIVVGMAPSVPAILDELVGVGDHVVLVADADPAKVRPEVHVVRGDPTQPTVIKSARPEGAQLAPDLPIVALVHAPSVREALRELGIQQTISAEELIAHALAKTLEAPHAGDMLTQLVESNQHSLTEIPADAATIGKRLSAVRDERSGLVLGLVHEGTFMLGIGEDPLVAPGDQLLIAEPLRKSRK